MKHLMLTTMLGVTALLAACGQKTESNETTAANSATEAASNKGEMSGDMGNMAMPADSAAKLAKGNGTVTAIDKAAGTVNLHHGTLPEANSSDTARAGKECVRTWRYRRTPDQL